MRELLRADILAHDGQQHAALRAAYCSQKHSGLLVALRGASDAFEMSPVISFPANAESNGTAS